MEKLYPIIRRVRRPLLPPDAPKTVEEIPPSPQPSPPGEGEAPAATEPSSRVESESVDSTPQSAPALVLEPAAPAVRRRRRKETPDAPQAAT